MGGRTPSQPWRLSSASSGTRARTGAAPRLPAQTPRAGPAPVLTAALCLPRTGTSGVTVTLLLFGGAWRLDTQCRVLAGDSAWGRRARCPHGKETQLTAQGPTGPCRRLGSPGLDERAPGHSAWAAPGSGLLPGAHSRCCSKTPWRLPPKVLGGCPQPGLLPSARRAHGIGRWAWGSGALTREALCRLFYYN